MFEAFCEEAGLREEVRKCMERTFFGHQDKDLTAQAREACLRQDQRLFTSLLSKGLEQYGAVYPLVLLGQCHDVTRRFYPDDAIRKATLGDIGVWEAWYEQYFGGIGLDHVKWVTHHACGKIWRLGRLQYELSTYAFPNVISQDPASGDYMVTEKPVPGLQCIEKEGMEVLRLHIPAGGSLLPALVDESLGKASAFFPACKIAVCDSWLMDPKLELVCQDSPNILSFMCRFQKFPIVQNGEPQIFERVFFFGATKADVLAFDCKTPLQRRVQEAVRSGVEFHTTGGFVELKGLA